MPGMSRQISSTNISHLAYRDWRDMAELFFPMEMGTTTHTRIQQNFYQLLVFKVPHSRAPPPGVV